MENITLVSYGDFKPEFLKEIAFHVVKEYEYPVSIKDGNLDLNSFYNPERRQYDANKILTEVNNHYHFNSIKILGLFSVDLYIPILTYIFGQAYLNGTTGIASTHRLKNERYGMPPDEKLLLDRTIKEAVHELGHTFGLKHCHNPVCVMRSSTYVEDLDQKEKEICMQCREILSNNA